MLGFTLPTTLCAQDASILMDINAKRLYELLSPASISIDLVLLLNSLLSLSMMFVVLRDIQSSSGNLKKDSEESIELDNDLTAEDINACRL